MTNQDAIYYLQYLRHDIVKDSPYDVAIVTAIASLTEKEQKTNGDSLRNMSDEQLAEYLRCKSCICQNEPDCEHTDCRTGILAWLRQEVSEDAGTDD